MDVRKIVSGALRAVGDLHAVDVTYTRGNNWTKIKATPGQSTFETTSNGVVVGDFRSRDFLFSGCDLVLNGNRVQPKRGDVIKQTVDAQTHTWMVSRPDGNAEQVWRFSDLGCTRIRVHTLWQGVA